MHDTAYGVIDNNNSNQWIKTKSKKPENYVKRRYDYESVAP